jgi:NhaA family Na+:H+ antiporter
VARASQIVTFIQEYSIPLIVGVVAGLVWANIDFHSYHELVEFDFWNFGKGPFLDDGEHHDLNDFYIFGKHVTVHFLVNEVFMVFFFGIAAKEITESILPGGALNPLPKAINPLMGTLGGVFGPVGLFILLALVFYGGSDEFGTVANGWAIPTATDIALAWLVARVIFGNRHPAVNFLLLLAVADDAIGLVIIAVFYSTEVQPLWLLLTAGGMAAAFLLRRFGVTWWPVYILIAGGMSWVGLVKAGVEPALALVVIVPFLPATHAAEHETEASEAGEHGAGEEAMAHAYTGGGHGHALGTLEQFEHHLKLPVDLGLFFFAWANAGVAFGNINSVTFMVLISLIVGKTVGVSLFSFIVSKLGFPLPEGMGLRHLAVAGMIAGLGLTVALFVANKAYNTPAGLEFLDPGKMGAVFSVIVAGLAFAFARGIGIRREPD